MRVRHRSEQYPRAFREGTAEFLGWAENGDALVRRDVPLTPNLPRETAWPAWALEIVEEN